MIKLFGGILTVIACTYMGIGINQRDKKQLGVLKSLIDDLSVLRINIGSFRMPLPEAFDSIPSGTTEIEALWRLCRVKIIAGTETFSEIWRKAIGKMFREEVTEILAPLGSILGSAPADEECTALNNTIERLSIMLKLREDAYIEKKKLTLRLGVSFGVLLVILLI